VIIEAQHFGAASRCNPASNRSKPMKAFLTAIVSTVLQLFFWVAMLAHVRYADDSDPFKGPMIWLLLAEALSVLMFILVPWFLACERKHKHRLAIFWLSLLLGWTILGWIIALVWACMDDGRAPKVKVNFDLASLVGLNAVETELSAATSEIRMSAPNKW